MQKIQSAERFFTGNMKTVRRQAYSQTCGTKEGCRFRKAAYPTEVKYPENKISIMENYKITVIKMLNMKKVLLLQKKIWYNLY